MADLSTWIPRARPARRPIEGDRVALEPLDAARHGDALFAAGAGPEAERIWRYLGDAPFADRASFDPGLIRAAASEDPLFFAVVDRASGRAEGRLSFMRIEPAHGVIETGNILFGPALARTAAASEAIFLQARYAFDDLGYRRLEWKCDARNAPSRRAAERFGFSFEGVFRQHMVVKGENRDTAWYAMLDRDWPQRRLAFRRFLAPENFDAAGRQRTSLGALNADTLRAAGLALRRADTADVSALAALQRDAYAPNRDILQREPLPLLADYDEVLSLYEVWLAESEGGLSGALILEPAADHLLVWSVAVAPAAQGVGLGDALLAAADARAAELGLGEVRLYTGEARARAIAWYERRGFALTRVEQRIDRRIVHMAKRLPATKSGDDNDDAGGKA